MIDPTMIIADDLTGAAEIAAFAGSSAQPARVTWTLDGLGRSDRDVGLVIDSETRDLTAAQAGQRLVAILAGLPGDALSGFVYKKIDSTLRGSIAAENVILFERMGQRPVILAPAYPEMGRTTRNGIQYLDGIAVSEGPAGRDPTRSAESSHLERALPAGPHAVIPAPAAWDAGTLADALRTHHRDGRHVIVDGERQADMVRLAEAISWLPPCLIVGSAGLARHMWTPRGPTNPEATAGRVVVVAGSDHPASRRQVDRLLAGHEGRNIGSARIDVLTDQRSEAIVVSTLARRVDPAVALRDLDRALEEVIAFGPPGALVVTGGTTALHVLRRLDAVALDVVGELAPGLPLGRVVGGAWANALLTTKAGGFGRGDVLSDAVARLRSPTPKIT